MGIETIAFAALTAFKAVSAIKSGNDQAKAITRQGELNAQAAIDQGNLASKEKAKQIRYATARQTTSFLNSGLTLEGTPSSVIDETYSTGLEDLDAIAKGYNMNSNNIITQANANSKQAISQARTDAIGAIADGVGGMDFGDMFSGGITVPFTGSSTTFSPNGVPIPAHKPTRINW